MVKNKLIQFLQKKTMTKLFDLKIMSALRPIFTTDSNPAKSTSTYKQKLQWSKKGFLL